MRLDQLIEDLPLIHFAGPRNAQLVGLTDDSRHVIAGSLFIARPGADGNALRFVPDAINAGAAALLLPAESAATLSTVKLPDTVSVILAKPGVAVDQRLCGKLAERFYDHPSRKLKLIGVTGTNGKTTTVTITRHLLNSAGHKCGLIGTVELDTGSPLGPRPATLTTPGAIELSQLLAEMVANGCTHCVMEVSSHALHQGRADHLRFAAAGFTNLTQDHLDYHGTMEAYADAKAILFESLAPDATAVVNADDAAASRMVSHCKAKIIGTHIDVSPSMHKSASTPAPKPQTPTQNPASVTPIELTAGFSRAQFLGPWGSFETTLPTPGLHNLSNALQAAALAHSVADLKAEQLKHGLQTCRPVPGRLEPVTTDWPHPPSAIRHPPSLPTVLVDYAHTPDALDNVGSAMRSLTKGKLITVFGCGGDRDRQKRPLMAKSAQRFADIVILTSDNPRTEDPQQILSDTAQGFTPHADAERSEASGTHAITHIIPDRAEAIRFAINLARTEDTVLIAGKGHEDYQIIGKTKHHFDDREQAAAALREKMKA